MCWGWVLFKNILLNTTHIHSTALNSNLKLLWYSCISISVRGSGQWFLFTLPSSNSPEIYGIFSTSKFSCEGIWKIKIISHFFGVVCNKGEQTWLHVGSIILALNFVFLYPCLVMLTLHLYNGAFPIAWNVQNSHFSRLSLPYLTFTRITVYMHMEIKSCRIENNVCSVGRFTGISWPDLHKQLKNKGLSHHLWGLANTKKFATVSHSPSRFGVKEAWILICNKIVPWDTTRVQSLGREDLLEKEMATHSSIIAWKIPWMKESGGL